MQNKLIFVSVVLAVFAVSALLGYKGPELAKTYSEQKAQDNFVPASVPKRQYDAFASQFNTVQEAKTPMAFPDDTLVDGMQKPVRLKSFSGTPILINLWATWCGPCVVELPSLEKFREHYKGRMEVMAISVDEGKSPAQLAEFFKHRNIKGLEPYLDQGGTAIKNLSLRGIPTSFLIGRDGQILYRFEGDADWTSNSTQEFFDVFLLQNR